MFLRPLSRRAHRTLRNDRRPSRQSIPAMKALTWQGAHDVRVETVPDPTIRDAEDILLRITATAICGSDLHLYRGKVPGMQDGDILGHEFMGIVEEVGPGIRRLRKGDRVVVPFTISCGQCFFCEKQLYS